MLKRLALILILLLPGVAQAQPEGELVVFAAASLAEAFEAAGEAFEAANPGTRVLFNFAGSSTLAAQLAQGAPADIFASANEAQMDAALESGRIDPTTRRTFAYNRLVLALPVDNPAQIESLRDLANDGVSLLVAAPGVPIRDYTDAMLLAADARFADDYREAVLANVVSEEPNVRQVAAKIGLGEADAGIIYASDVTTEMIALPIPDAFNQTATYPIALTDDTPQAELASQFLDFVLSTAGQEMLAAADLIPVQVQINGSVANPLTLSPGDLGDVPLFNLISMADPDPTPYPLSRYLLITNAAGQRVVVAWGELNEAVIFTADFRLILPVDARRSLENVTSISLRDAG